MDIDLPILEFAVRFIRRICQQQYLPVETRNAAIRSADELQKLIDLIGAAGDAAKSSDLFGGE